MLRDNLVARFVGAGHCRGEYRLPGLDPAPRASAGVCEGRHFARHIPAKRRHQHLGIALCGRSGRGQARQRRPRRAPAGRSWLPSASTTGSPRMTRAMPRSRANMRRSRRIWRSCAAELPARIAASPAGNVEIYTRQGRGGLSPVLARLLCSDPRVRRSGRVGKARQRCATLFVVADRITPRNCRTAPRMEAAKKISGIPSPAKTMRMATPMPLHASESYVCASGAQTGCVNARFRLRLQRPARAIAFLPGLGRAGDRDDGDLLCDRDGRAAKTSPGMIRPEDLTQELGHHRRDHLLRDYHLHAAIDAHPRHRLGSGLRGACLVRARDRRPCRRRAGFRPGRSGRNTRATAVGALVDLALMLALMFWPSGDSEAPTRSPPAAHARDQSLRLSDQRLARVSQGRRGRTWG